MSAEAAAVVRRWWVGDYRVTLTCPRPKAGEAVSVAIEWAPSVPKSLTEAEWRDYRAGRDAALAEAASRYGIKALVLEL